MAAALFVLATMPLAPLLAREIVFPAEHWPTAEPSELGLDPQRLNAVAVALGGRGCIIKDGYVVKSWGSQSDKSDWFSSAKPVLSTLLMFAIQEGKVANPDAKLIDFGWQLSEKDRDMTFRHLGAMTSGYARPEPPGAAWSYNDFAIQLYQQTLFDRVFKDTPENVVAATNRLGALGLEDGLELRRKNRRISASVRDFARIAWLWLNRGQWRGKQLIRRDLIDDCLRPQVPIDLPITAKATTNDYLRIGSYGGDSDHFSKAGPGVYGFNWWFNAKGGRHPESLAWPDAPPDTFMSLGLHGNNTAMLPSLRLLVVSAEGDWGSGDPGRRDGVTNQRLRLIAYAGTPVQPADAPPKSTATAPWPDEPVLVTGPRVKWQPLTLVLRGPAASETGTPNPFLDYRVSVTFRQGDEQRVVNGYYAADGRAAESGADAGDRWLVKFVPDLPGEWTWKISFRAGSKVAIDGAPDGAPDGARQAGRPIACDGASGTFSIAAAESHAPGFYSQGRVRYVGQRYLQCAETGQWFLKSGADSPENLLAYVDFDGTTPTHHFGPHMLDARPDDPTWRGGRGRNLLGAMNYLAGKGVNSIYFLTMNVKGDGKDVWPWVAPQARTQFDCSKLDQWEILLTHLDRLGICQHVVTQEQENDQLLDDGELGDERRLYYRELVARFGHHLAVVWNLGEENTNSTAQLKAFSTYLHQLDPYDNPVVVHTFPNQIDQVFEPLLGFEHLEGASLQTNKTRLHTRRWIERSSAAGRQWFVCLDEIGPAKIGVKPDAVDYEHDEVRRDHLWPHLMSGGAGVEWLFGYAYPHDDIKLEDFRSRDHMWDLTRFAVEFFREHLPFQEMQPADDVAGDKSVLCLARPRETYALYLPQGRTTDVKLPAGNYLVRWFDPRTGGPLRPGSVEQLLGGSEPMPIGTPPRQVDRDWVCLISRQSEG